MEGKKCIYINKVKKYYQDHGWQKLETNIIKNNNVYKNYSMHTKK